MLLAKVTFNSYIFVHQNAFLILMSFQLNLKCYLMFTCIFINQGLITSFICNCYYKKYKCIENRLEKNIKVFQ